MSLSHVTTFLRAWFQNFRTKEFTAILTAAGSLATVLCDVCHVPADKRGYIIAFFVAGVGISYILNPKYTAWLPQTNETVNDLAAIRNIKADYAAVSDLLDPMDESRDKDPFDPYSNSIAGNNPLYRNSADEEGK